MKIYNAQLVGASRYEDRHYYHFLYESKFIVGYGCLVAVSFTPIDNLFPRKRYDVYMTDKNGYHNIRAIYEHKDKNTDRNTIDSN